MDAETEQAIQLLRNELRQLSREVAGYRRNGLEQLTTRNLAYHALPFGTSIPSRADRDGTPEVVDATTVRYLYVYTGYGATGWERVALTESGGLGMKTSGGGYFLIPTAPAVGTTVAQSASANTYGSWVELSAAAPADLFIVGFYIENSSAPNTASTYGVLDIGTGAAASESSVGEFPFSGYATAAGWRRTPEVLPFPIPVASGTRIAGRTASSAAAADNWQVTLICINQSDLVPI